jgi:hypothetical protein
MHQFHRISPQSGALARFGSLRDSSLDRLNGRASGAKALCCVVFPLVSYSGSVPTREIRTKQLFHKHSCKHLQSRPIGLARFLITQC